MPKREENTTEAAARLQATFVVRVARMMNREKMITTAGLPKWETRMLGSQKASPKASSEPEVPQMPTKTMKAVMMGAPMSWPFTWAPSVLAWRV